jgi:hypothetical protein
MINIKLFNFINKSQNIGRKRVTIQDKGIVAISLKRPIGVHENIFLYMTRENLNVTI